MKSNGNMVKSLNKALDVLEYIARSNDAPNIARISSALDIDRNAVHRLVKTLENRGYLDRNERTKTLRLGYRVLPLAARFLDRSRLRIESFPYLQELADQTGERVNLGVLEDFEVVYLGGIEKPSLPSVYSRFGKTAPAHACSLGKIILAYLPPGELEEFLEQKQLLPSTPHTITDTDALKSQLDEIRTRGYALDCEEHLDGSFCISGLIRGAEGFGIGAISISCNDMDSCLRYKDRVIKTAEVISHLMGYTLR